MVTPMVYRFDDGIIGDASPSWLYRRNDSTDFCDTVHLGDLQSNANKLLNLLEEHDSEIEI